RPTRLSMPERTQLILEMMRHAVSQNAIEIVEQMLLRLGAKHAHRLAVDVAHNDLLHAQGDKVRSALQVSAKLVDAAGAHLIEQAPDAAEILLPERDRRVLEEERRVLNRQGIRIGWFVHGWPLSPARSAGHRCARIKNNTMI